MTKEFNTQWDFAQFCTSVLERFRYVHEADVDSFLDVVKETALQRIETIGAEKVMWRAQIGCDTISLPSISGKASVQQDKAYGEQRMKPIPGRQNPGRLNAHGTNCLYLAFASKKGDDEPTELTKIAKNTAIAEVRPFVNAMVSVAVFTNRNELRIVNCARGGTKIWFSAQLPNKDDMEDLVWSRINTAFTKPVSPGEEPGDYVPTQILAELFRSEGYDGVAYKSALGEGYNLALFDLDIVDFIRSELHQVNAVNYHTIHLPISLTDDQS